LRGPTGGGQGDGSDGEPAGGTASAGSEDLREPSARATPPQTGSWGLVAACFALMTVTSGVWYTGSVFFVAFVQDFGWDYSSTSSIFSLFTVLYGISGVLVGVIADRVGVRRVILGGGAVLVVALLGDSLATSRWHLYLTHSALVALGLAGMGWVPVSILLARGFQKRRGLALGLASSGVGVGIMVFVPLSQIMIDRFGWRTAFVFLAAIAAAVTFPIGLFAVRSPRAPAVSGDPIATTASPRRGAPGWTLGSALRSRVFWLVGASFMLLNGPVQMILTHQVAYLVEVGQPKAFAAGVMGLIGLLSAPGKILWGWLSDRWWIESTYAVAIASLVGGIFALLAVGPETSAWGLYGYAVLMGFGYAVAPAMTPILSARFFAGQNFGAIFGAFNCLHHTGGAIGVWLAGYSHDITGSYVLSLRASIASVCLALACVSLAAPRRVAR
jgi:MFS family permease